MSNSSERTEKPTSRRRQRASEEGKFAQSKDLTSAVTLAVALTTLFYSMGTPANFQRLMSSLLATAIQGPATELTARQLIRETGVFFLRTVSPVIGAAALASLAATVVQGVPSFGASITGLKWEHLNPIQGLSRLKSKISLSEWVKIMIFVAVAGAAFWSTISLYWYRIVTLPAQDMVGSNQLLRAILMKLCSTTVGAAVVIAVGDFFVQKFKFEKSLMMTKEEVREDAKSSDGNPAVKSKIKMIQREQSRKRMMARLKSADVIVTNPTHFAVALEYKPESMSAPRVVAKGTGWLALKIKELGRNYDIPTVENVPLARALYHSVELEQEIPLELYKAVAEVLAYVFKIRKRM